MSIEEIRQITKAAIAEQEDEQVRRSNRLREYVENCMVDVRECILAAAKQGRFDAIYTESMLKNYLALTEFGIGGDILKGIRQTLINEGYAVPSNIYDRIFIEWK